MFSGIVEETATVTRVVKDRENIHFSLSCSFLGELGIDQSVSHDGVCLTVVKVSETEYTVTAIQETLLKTNLGSWQPGTKVNLERSVLADGRLDGHMVQGHVDLTARCTEVRESEGSWYYTFEYEPHTEEHLTVEKGSVSVNGVSLTVVNSQATSFQVAIIPYTYEVTNFHEFKPGTVVNIEFDIIGKYIAKILKQLGKI
ncbi:riboflavin synthase [Bacteroidota bacterium]